MSTFENDQQLRFPAQTVMKVIAETSKDDPDFKRVHQKIADVFEYLILEPTEWKIRESNKKRYVSFSTSVLVQNREQLRDLYQNLLELPEVRQVL